MGSADKHLTKITDELEAGETVLASLTATITDKPDSLSGTTRGSLVVTDRRFIFSGAAWGSKTSRSFLLSQVTSIDLHKNLLVAYVQVTIAGGFERFLVKYKDAEGFVAVAHKALAQPATPQSGSAADELTKLAALHSQGVLSDEEFAAAKAKALS